MEEKPEQTGDVSDDELDDAEAEQVNQPGLSELRAVVARHLRRGLPGRASLRRDAVAGVSSAISNVPDGMANGLLVGVNPLHGLYAIMMGPAVGGIFSSSQLMIISTTAAASLSASQALGGLTGRRAPRVCFCWCCWPARFRSRSG